MVFEITARFKEPVGEAEHDALLDGFMTFIEQRGLGLSMFTGIYPVMQLTSSPLARRP